jgi:hypothetical protein
VVCQHGRVGQLAANTVPPPGARETANLTAAHQEQFLPAAADHCLGHDVKAICDEYSD